MKKLLAPILMAFCCALFAPQTRAEDAIPIMDMVKEAESNQMRFNKTFKDKQFDVTGQIFKIEEKQGKYIVYLQGAANKNPFKAVACEFDPKYENALMDLNTGQTIVAHCVYRGKKQFEMGAFTLVDCEPK